MGDASAFRKTKTDSALAPMSLGPLEKPSFLTSNDSSSYGTLWTSISKPCSKKLAALGRRSKGLFSLILPQEHQECLQWVSSLNCYFYFKGERNKLLNMLGDTRRVLGNQHQKRSGEWKKTTTILGDAKITILTSRSKKGIIRCLATFQRLWQWGVW